MPATFQTVREIALRMPGVEEGTCFGTPCLRVGKKLMARMWEDGETLVAKVEMDERARLLDESPDVFFLTDHYLNYPCILVRLDAVPLSQLRTILDGAWRKVASKRQLAARGVAASAGPSA